MRKLFIVFGVVLFIFFWVLPAFADEVTINLDPSTPYVDIPITITEPVEATINTVNGTPQTNPAFIDSWIEVWQGLNKLRANDDGLHSATNVLASIITMPLTAGEYFIRATSFAWMASNNTQFPTGSYLLQTNLVLPTPTPSPTNIQETLTPSPTPTPTPTESQTPSPTPEPTIEPTPTPSPTVDETVPTEQENNNQEPIEQPIVLPELVEELVVVEELEEQINIEDEFADEEYNVEEVTDAPESLIEQIREEALEQYNPDYEYQLDEIIPLEEVFENLSEEETLELLETLEPNQLIEYTDGVVLEVGVVIVFELLDNPVALLGEVFSDPGQAVEAFLQVGADMSVEEREESEKVIIASVIVGQITLATSVTMISGTGTSSAGGGASGSSGTIRRRLN
jgi:hypothetical protein